MIKQLLYIIIIFLNMSLKLSIWNWNTDYIVDYKDLINYCNDNEIQTVFQYISSDTDFCDLDNYIYNLRTNNIDMYAVIGDPSYCVNYDSCIKKLYNIVEYNNTYDNKINCIILDNEVYTINDYKNNEQYYNELFIDNTKKYYEYCNSNEIKLYVCVGPTQMKNHEDLQIICKDYCDGVVLMNYVKEDSLDNLEYIVNLVKSYDKDIINVADFKSEQLLSLMDANKIFYELHNKIDYNNISYSYHHYGDV